MFFTNLIVSSLIAATVAMANPRADPLPYKFAMMSVNEAFGLVGRQSNGYAPSSIFCGKGNDCQSACGTNTAQCASTDGRLHCFRPATQKCCQADGLGNACRNGYFCTSNAQGTWCCPDGMSLDKCADLYGVSSLVSEVASATTLSTSEVASNVYSTSTTAPEPTYTSPTSTITDVTETYYSTTTMCPSCAIPSYTSSPNGTVATAEPPLQFTNVANHLAHGALPALALAAGAVLGI